MNVNAIYFKEWLKLKPCDFRIVNMLALSENGKFTGNLTDLCNKFSLSSQDNNRKRIEKSIKLLEKNSFITVNKSGKTYTLNVVPKETKIQVEKCWIETILTTDFSESVSKEAVIKCLLWLINNNEEIITNKSIAADLNCCIDTITKAKNVLQRDFNLINKNIITEKSKNLFVRKGQQIDVNVWIGK